MMRLPDSDLESARLLPVNSPIPGNGPDNGIKAPNVMSNGNRVVEGLNGLVGPATSLPTNPLLANQIVEHHPDKPMLAADMSPACKDGAVDDAALDDGAVKNVVAAPVPIAERPMVMGHENSPNSESPNGEFPNGNSSNGGSPNGDAAGPGGEMGEDSYEPGFLPVLKNRNFLTLWSGQVFSQLADKVYLVLMIAIIASRFQGEGQTISGWVSAIMIAFTIPAILFGSIAGAYVDRWPKKGVLVLTNLLRGGLVFTLPFLLWLCKSWHPFNGVPVGFLILLGITFLVSTLTQFFAPAEQSAIPLVVERRHLLSANSLYTTTMMASVIIGFAVGEPLLALFDTVTDYLGWTAPGLGKELVVGSGYAIAGILLLLLRTGEDKQALRQKAIEAPHVFEDIRDGLRYLGQQHRVRSAMLKLVILFSVFAALAVLSVRLAEIMPEIKSSQFGFLLAAGGVGMAIGATFVGQFGQRFARAQLSFGGSMGMAASLLGLSLFPNHVFPAVFLIATLGLFAAVIGVPMQTAIQEETPEAMRGKVFGLQNNAINIALSLPLALAGVAETFLGLRIVFIGLAALVITGEVVTWYISRIDR
jgi:MFS family permease